MAGAPVGLANLLSVGPLSATRRQRLNSVRRQNAVRGQVGDVGQIHLESPQRAWHPALWRHTEFGRVSVPLGPRRLFAVGKVERTDHLSALPPTVRRLRSPSQRICARPAEAPPHARDADRGRDDLDQEKESFSSSATSRETSLYRPSLRASSGRSSSSAGSGFWSQTAT